MKNPFLVPSFISIAFSLGCSHSTPYVGSPQTAGLACEQLPNDSQQVLDAVLTPGMAFNAQPINEVRVRVRASQEPQFAGAQMQLPAPQNASKEYLERVLTCHARTEVASYATDPFHPTTGSVESIDVKSYGPTIAVEIRGSSKAANREILYRAQQLSTPTTEVVVEQIGSTQPAPRF